MSFASQMRRNERPKFRGSTGRPVLVAVDHYDDLDQETLSMVGALLAESDSIANETADLRGANGHWHVWLAGCHNHHTPAITELFRSIARAAPGSYGILYTFDDEASDGWDRWVMRRGSVYSAQDEDLSPHVGVVEDPLGTARTVHLVGIGHEPSS